MANSTQSLIAYLDKLIKGARWGILASVICFILGSVFFWYLAYAPNNPSSLLNQLSVFSDKRSQVLNDFDKLNATTDLEKRLIESNKQNLNSLCSLAGVGSQFLFVFILMLILYPSSLVLIVSLIKFRQCKKMQELIKVEYENH